MGKILTICALVVALAGCGNEEVKEKPDQTNSQYVKMVLKKNYDLKKYQLVNSISEILDGVDHINPEPYEGDAKIMNTPSPIELKKFKKKNLIKVYYLLQALSDSDFRQKIGEELEKDMNDTSCEYGGVLYLLENGEVKIQMLPHDPLKCSLDIRSKIGSLADYRYCLPDVDYAIDKLAVFHFHSHKTYNRQSTALSPGDGGIVFSRMDGNRFNVDIGLRCKKEFVNLDLGVYRY